MEDNPQEQFERQVLIALEASMKGIKEALAALSAMAKHAGITERSMESMGRAEKEVNRITKDVTASFNKYSKKLAAATKAQKNFYEAGRAMGSIIRTATKGAVAGITALGIVVKRTGDTMVQFETVSINAESAVGRLQIAYSNMAGTANRAMVSVQDLAGELTKFQSKGIAEMMLGMEKSFQQGMGGLLGVMQRGLGKQAGAAMLQDVLTSLEDQFDVIDKNVMGRVGKLSDQMQAARVGGNVAGAMEFGTQIIRELTEIQVYAKDGGLAIQKMINNIARETGRLAGTGSGLTEPIRAWRDALARVGTIFEKIEQQVLGAFGTDIAKVIEDLSKFVDSNMESMLEHVSALFESFSKWGGIEKLFKETGKILKTILGILKPLGTMLAYLAQKFIEYGTAGKAAMLGIGAVLISSNIRSLLMGIGKGAFYSGKMLWGAQKGAVAYAAALKGADATSALSKMQHLKGIGVTAAGAAVGGVGGFFGGEAAARGLGAEKGGLGEDIGGVAGASLGAGLLTMNPYIALTAAVVASGKAIYDTNQQINKSEEALKSLSATTKKYADHVDDFRSKAEGPYAKARADVKDLEVEINKLDEQIMAKKQGAIWRLGFFADTSDLEEKLKEVRNRHRRMTVSVDAVRPPDAEDQAIKIGIDLGALRDTISVATAEFQKLEKQTPILHLKGVVELDAYHKALKKAQDNLKETNEQIGKLKEIGINTDDLEVAVKRAKDLEQNIKDLETAGMGATSAFASLAKELGRLRVYERLLGGLSGAMSNLKTVVDTLGPSATVAGENIADMMDAGSARQLMEAFKAIEASTAAISGYRAKISEAELERDTKKAAFWYGKLEEATNTVKLATGTIESSIENTLAPLEKQASIVRSMTELRKADLEISQNLYGTPALAVQAQLNIVQLMQQEKELVENQLAALSSRIDMLRSAGVAEENLIGLRQKEIDLAGKARKITAQQVASVRQLRDGYLDSLRAMVSTSGRFSIIITQDKNVMRGLQKEAFKRNFLLGQYAEDAAKSDAQAYRFSAQGQGILETTSGQIMSPQDIAKAVYDRVSNISDPLSKASALQSADIFMNIVSGADKNTRDLGSIFMVGQDRVVDAINNLAEQRLAGAAAGLALGGDVPAGITALGSAMDKAGRGEAPPPGVGFEGVVNTLKQMQLRSGDDGAAIQKIINQLELNTGKPIRFDPGAYRKLAEAQGSSQGSIDAMVNYLQGQRQPSDPRDSRSRIDPSAANNFFSNAFGYYEQMIKAFGGDLPKTEAPARGQTNYGRYRRSLSSPSLKRIDADVRKHEKAHKSAAGSLGQAPQYQYKKGADGKLYATGGHVIIDASPVAGDPLATINKMRTVQQAALAPDNPSQQDLEVAAMAAEIEKNAYSQLGDALGRVTSGKRGKTISLTVPSIASRSVSMSPPKLGQPPDSQHVRPPTAEEMEKKTEDAFKAVKRFGKVVEDAQSFRFSAQGQGILETTSGQIISPQDIAKAVYDRVASISDPLSKASALQSADIFVNIVSGANKNTQDLGNIFMTAQDNNATRIVDAISAQSEAKIVIDAPVIDAPMIDVPAAGQATYRRSLSSPSLKRIDADVRKHEKAHKAAAGSLGRAPQYQYKKGADGKLYATGGHVMIDASPVSGDPLATINKMRTVQQAALAPDNPSQQDLEVAAMAAEIEKNAYSQLGSMLGRVTSGKRGKAISLAAHPSVSSPPDATVSMSLPKLGQPPDSQQTEGIEQKSLSLVSSLKDLDKAVQAEVKLRYKLARAAEEESYSGLNFDETTMSLNKLNTEMDALEATIAYRAKRVGEANAASGQKGMVDLLKKLDSTKPLAELVGLFKKMGDDKLTKGLEEALNARDELKKSQEPERTRLEKEISSRDKRKEETKQKGTLLLDKAVKDREAIELKLPPGLKDIFNEFSDATSKFALRVARAEAMPDEAPDRKKTDFSEKKITGAFQKKENLRTEALEGIKEYEYNESIAQLGPPLRPPAPAPDFMEPPAPPSAVSAPPVLLVRPVEEVVGPPAPLPVSAPPPPPPPPPPALLVRPAEEVVDSPPPPPAPPTFDYVNQLPGVIDMINNMQTNLLAPYTETLKSDFKSLGDMATKLESAEGSDKGELQAEIDKMSKRIGSTSNLVRNIFGATGFDAVNEALSEFDSDMAKKASKQVSGYEEKIAALESEAQKATPNIKQSLNKEVQVLQSKINDIKIDFGTGDIDRVMDKTEKPAVAEDGISKKAKEYGSAVKHLEGILGKKVDLGDMNLSQASKVTREAETALSYYAKQYKQLAANKALTQKHVADLFVANQMIADAQKQEKSHQQARGQLENKRIALSEKEVALQEQVSNMKLPLAEVDKLAGLEKKRAETGAFTAEQLRDQLPEISKIATAYRKATGKQVDIPEDPGAIQAASQADLEDKFGKDWKKIAAQANNIWRDLQEIGTSTPGSVGRGGERLKRYAGDSEAELVSTRAELTKVRSQEKIADMPAQSKQMARTLAPIKQVLGDALKGFVSGGIVGAVTGIQGGFEDRKVAADQQRMSAQGDEIMNALNSSMSPVSRNLPSGSKDARLQGVPTLQAYDTDSFTRGGGTRKFEAEMGRQFGRERGAGIAQQAQRVREAESKLQQAEKTAERGLSGGVAKQQFGVGVASLHGFEIPGTAKAGRRAPQVPQPRPMTTSQEKGAKSRVESLKKIRDNEKKRLDKMTESASKKMPGGMTDAQFKRMDAEKAKVERAATDKAGITYSSRKDLERVKDITFPENVLPAGTVGAPAPGQKRQLSGVSDPIKTRGLSHGKISSGAGGDGERANRLLREAGEIIARMGKKGEATDVAQSNITQRASNRLFNVQPSTP